MGKYTFVDLVFLMDTSLVEIHFLILAYLHNVLVYHQSHAQSDAFEVPLTKLQEDLALVHDCALGIPHGDNDRKWQHVMGGYSRLPPGNLPIYFHDEDYRQRRAAHVRQMVMADNAYISALQANDGT
jgi:hypothetical protein